MPDKKKKGAQSKAEQLKSTKTRLDEAEDRLDLSNMSKEEKHNIRQKNENRASMIAGLETELEDGFDEEP